jgi:uncharacterized protein YndB with AHSA1/START domain
MNEQATFTSETSLRIERLLPGPIERAWEYLTQSDKRALWFAAGEWDLRVGGKADLVFDHANLSAEKDTPEPYRKYMNVKMTGEILRIEPPRLVAFRWDDEDGGTEVTFELTRKGSDVLLAITHSRAKDRAALGNYASGWHAHIDILEDRLRGREPRGFWSNHARLEREYGAAGA